MISQKVAEEISNRKFESAIVLSPSYGEKRFVYIPAYSEFYKSFRLKKDYLYVFIHPELLDPEDHCEENSREFRPYFNNILLIEKLRMSNEPIMLVLEKRVLLGKKTIHKSFYPRGRELLVLTEPGVPKFCEYIETPYGLKEINFGQTFIFLRMIGLKEGRFAGKYRTGCVKNIAKKFHDQGITVRGVKGCIHPTPNSKEKDEILKMLYDNPFVPNF